MTVWSGLKELRTWGSILGWYRIPLVERTVYSLLVYLLIFGYSNLWIGILFTNLQNCKFFSFVSCLQFEVGSCKLSCVSSLTSFYCFQHSINYPGTRSPLQFFLNMSVQECQSLEFFDRVQFPSIKSIPVIGLTSYSKQNLYLERLTDYP